LNPVSAATLVEISIITRKHRPPKSAIFLILPLLIYFISFPIRDGERFNSQSYLGISDRSPVQLGNELNV
jgi:hypothetical protein